MQHITSLKLVLRPANHGSMPFPQVPSLGPFFQGALLERVDDAYAGWLHSQPFNPYSQFCYGTSDGAVVWRINALNDEAAGKIIEPLRVLDDGIELRSICEKFEVTQSTIETIGQKVLLDCIADEAENKFKIRFITPTSFKSGGHYVIMPSVRLLFQNLLMHYSKVYEGDKEVDPDTLSYIEEHVHITSYDLKSHYFANVSSGGRKIPAFMGSMTLVADGPKPLVGLVRMLLMFGSYSGVGIKTSMGMGGFCSL